MIESDLISRLLAIATTIENQNQNSQKDIVLILRESATSIQRLVDQRVQSTSRRVQVYQSLLRLAETVNPYEKPGAQPELQSPPCDESEQVSW